MCLYCCTIYKWNCPPPDAKTVLKVVVIVHITFERGLLTWQKLAFFYHMDIADRISPKKGGVCVFRSENTTPRITSARRTLDKQAKQTTDTTLHHNFAIWTRTNAHTMHISQIYIPHTQQYAQLIHLAPLLLLSICSNGRLQRKLLTSSAVTNIAPYPLLLSWLSTPASPTFSVLTSHTCLNSLLQLLFILAP